MFLKPLRLGQAAEVDNSQIGDVTNFGSPHLDPFSHHQDLQPGPHGTAKARASTVASCTPGN